MPPLPFGPLCRVFAASLALPLSALAQSQTHDHTSTVPPSGPPLATPNAPTPSGADWAAANHTVARYPRGHIDILRAEPPLNTPDAAAPATPVWSLEQVLQSALSTRPDLLAHPGMGLQDQTELRVQTQAFVLSTQAAWLEAITAQQAWLQQQNVLHAAEAGAELAQRMRQVGNWPAARHMQEELTLWQVRAQHLQAQNQAQQAQAKLWRLLNHRNTAQTPFTPAALPKQLPALPSGPQASVNTLEEQALQQHPRWPLLHVAALQQQQGLPAGTAEQLQQAIQNALQQAHGQWPATLNPATLRLPASALHAWETQAQADALERQIRADVRLALSAWHTSRQLAQQSRQDVQRLQDALHEETQLRYNGMLASTWDLLASARAQAQADSAALLAERDAWLAHLQLQAVLSGLPYNAPAASAAAESAAPTSAGH